MATDKRAFSDFFFGSIPSKSLAPPVPGYDSPDSLPVAVDGNNFDVLAFDVDAARALLSKAGFPNGIGPDGRRLEITYDFPVLPETRPKAEIHQQQWRRHLNVNLKLVPREFNVHFRMVYEGAYTGVAECSFITSYLDPNPFLDPFVTSSVVNPSGWTDPAYDSLLAHANALTNAGDRMRKLAECEKRLLEAMPIIPVYVAGLAYLKKPYVRGLGSNLFDVRPFKYVWIDTNWRPQ
jgi:oligopeptide transport system substrate-binding protein